MDERIVANTPAPPVRIACFGDSLTEGHGLLPNEALPVILEQMLRKSGIRTTFLNHGVSGDTSGDGLSRISKVIKAEPDAVIVEFGANDCFAHEPIKNIRRNLMTMIETFLDKNIPILLVGITAHPDFGLDYKAEFDPLFQGLANKYDLPLFPDILSCYFDDPTMMLMDKMHPNEQGVIAIAQELFPQVKELAITAKK